MIGLREWNSPLDLQAGRTEVGDCLKLLQPGLRDPCLSVLEDSISVEKSGVTWYLTSQGSLKVSFTECMKTQPCFAGWVLPGATPSQRCAW